MALTFEVFVTYQTALATSKTLLLYISSRFFNIFAQLPLLSVARKQRKRILAETTIASADNSTELLANRMSFVLRFLSL